MMEWRDLVNRPNGEYVIVDTRVTPDAGWETMVFRATKNGCMMSGHDLDADWYGTAAEAEAGHLQMIEKWEKQ